ncbi:hypothetical protein A3K72_00090 [Candidatus Woesearchaeota archaeon RBG_13_36_6]|nr:MAG: hypothetical protein A3K72_00090 [Candidatus Woesearchaeota archaeon RBG_13_36_6]
MTSHHLIKNTVECIYCGKNDLKKEWFSEWNAEHHYKCFLCPHCGKHNHIRVNFHGSGHDDASGLEKKII